MNRISRAVALTLAAAASVFTFAVPAQAAAQPAVGCRDAHAQQDLQTRTGQRMGTDGVSYVAP